MLKYTECPMGNLTKRGMIDKIRDALRIHPAERGKKCVALIEDNRQLYNCYPAVYPQKKTER